MCFREQWLLTQGTYTKSQLQLTQNTQSQNVFKKPHSCSPCYITCEQSWKHFESSFFHLMVGKFRWKPNIHCRDLMYSSRVQFRPFILSWWSCCWSNWFRVGYLSALILALKRSIHSLVTELGSTSGNWNHSTEGVVLLLTSSVESLLGLRWISRCRHISCRPWRYAWHLQAKTPAGFIGWVSASLVHNGFLG